MPILKLPSHDMHYQVFGKPHCPALVFSNSLGTNLNMWHKQIQALQDAFYIVCYDNRGHGLSGTPVQGFGLHDLGQDVVALLDHLNIESAHFCGISMGGLTGQWLAIYHPQRFKSVIVSNTAAKIGETQAWHERAALVRENGLMTVAQSAPSRWFTQEFVQKHPEVVQNMVHDLASGSTQGYAQCCEALAEADLRAQLMNVDIPMLIIAGMVDPVTTVEDALSLQASIFGSQLHEVKASHIANVEASDAFNHAIQLYLQHQIGESKP